MSPRGRTISQLGRKLSAVGLTAALAAAALGASAARVAEGPAAGANAAIGTTGPGALGKVRSELAKLGQAKTEFDRAAAQRALAAKPLSSEPFVALAGATLVEDPGGRTGREATLLAEALRRDPRSRPARILLMRQQAAKGDLSGAFGQLAILYRFSPPLVEQVIEAITTRITGAKQVNDALSAIKGHPGLYAPFVIRMGTKAKPRDVVLALAGGLPPGVLQNPDVRASLVRQLLAVGEFAEARRFWQGGNAAPGGNLIHAPDFADQTSPPPFNWELFVSATGAAEYSRDGGLTLAYYDREAGTLVRQVLTLAPGSYRALADFSMISGTTDNVRLRLTCFGQTDPLAELALLKTKPGAGALPMPFVIPASGCGGQTLTIVGVASSERGEVQMTVRRIDIQPAGSN